MASKVVAFLALCCLLQAAKQVAAGRGRILEEPDYDAWLNGNLADAKINKITRKLTADNNNESTLYTDMLNNPTKYARQQNDTPKNDVNLNEDVLYDEILKNPSKFNAILNDTALNNDPAAKIIQLNETAVFNEILHNPIKYTNSNNLQYSTILNATAPKNDSDVAKYNTAMGFWGDVLNNWIESNTWNDNIAYSDKDETKSTTEYNTVFNDADNYNSTAAKYSTIF